MDTSSVCRTLKNMKRMEKRNEENGTVRLTVQDILLKKWVLRQDLKIV